MGDLPLPKMVAGIDAALEGDHDSAILRVTGHPPQVACRPLEDHPLGALLGFAAPDDWRALGIRCSGRARRLHPPRTGHPGDRATPTPVVLTMLIDRTGRGAGIMRHGHGITRLQGPPEGVLADACRRALGLATAPPPPHTVELWMLIWLDRLVDTVAVLGPAERYATWETIAALHPAAPGQPAQVWRDQPPLAAASLDTMAAPIVLAEATRQLAEAWPWGRLRADPDVADTAAPPLPPDIAQWMDDGMFARWLLAELPDLADLTSAVGALLPRRLVAAIARTVAAAGVPWPSMASNEPPA